jgi:hypothetical protein
MRLGGVERVHLLLPRNFKRKQDDFYVSNKLGIYLAKKECEDQKVFVKWEKEANLLEKKKKRPGDFSLVFFGGKKYN